MRSRAVPLVAAVVLSALLVLGAILAKRSRHPFGVTTATDTQDDELPVLFPAPAWRFVDQAGRTTTSASLAGTPYVADFVFTQCRTVCPMLTARMAQLQRDLAGVDVRFVSFSVDPVHDGPAQLAAYAHEWAEGETRWTLLATTEDGLAQLVRGFHVLRETTNDPNDPIVHTSMFFLVDDKGQVRGTFDSEHREELESLERAVRALAHAPAGSGHASAELPRDGDSLYHALSCVNCHERNDLAPPLADVRGRRRELESGVAVVADEGYVRESIVQPDAKRVRGYPLRMPTYDGVLDEARLKTLVDWVLARHGEKPIAADENVRVERDPVCGMNVRVTAESVKAEAGGHTTYFCSEYCRDRFLANPSAYPSPEAAPRDR